MVKELVENPESLPTLGEPHSAQALFICIDKSFQWEYPNTRGSLQQGYPQAAPAVQESYGQDFKYSVETVNAYADRFP